MKELTRPTWLEINLDYLISNYSNIRQHIKSDTEIMAIVKADAYENGAINIVKELIRLGVRKYGVAHLSEALHLRKYFKEVEILILGYTPNYLFKQAIENNISITIYNLSQVEFLSSVADQLEKDAYIHLKIETGMNRLGFMPVESSIKDLKKIYSFKNIKINGIFTHYAASDENHVYTEKQTQKFNYVINKMKENGLKIPIRHTSNSAAILNFSEYNFDMVRAGIILYGVYPLRTPKMMEVPLKNILSIKSQISNVKLLAKDEEISYGLTYKTTKQTKVATVPIGYADGFSRALSNKGEAIVNNSLVPIIGRICMDQLMLDVSGLDVCIGDEVIFMGESGDCEISIESIAQKIGGIPAEVFCMLNKRIPRVYVRNGEIQEVVDYLLEI